MQKLRSITALLVLTLPLASFAYESEDRGQDGYMSIQVHPPQLNPSQIPSSLSSQQQAVTVPEPEERNIANKIKRIDQEILILRAELSLRRGEIEQVRHYISKLNRMVIFPVFQQRIAYLKQFLITGRNTGLMAKIKSEYGSSEPDRFGSNSHLKPLLIVRSIQPLDSPMHKSSAVIVVLLPLSGNYEQVGTPLFNSLNDALAKNGFNGTVAVFDTALYQTAEGLWNVIKSYEPDFVFGPLQKGMALDWHALNTGVPTLYFNELDFMHGYERSLSPNRAKGLEQVFSVLESQAAQNVLVISDQTDSARKLESEFYQAWVSRNREGLYQHHEVDSLVSQTIGLAMNAKRSKQRKSWLERVTKRQLSFRPRTRTDFDVVLSFLPENKALQVGPMLEFYQLTDVAHIWYPSQTPKAESLKANLPSWQKTTAVLPAHIKMHLLQSDQQNTLTNETGLFYALGQVAIEIVNNPALSDGLDIEFTTEFGAVISNSVGQFFLLPTVYWIDQGVLEQVSEFSESSF